MPEVVHGIDPGNAAISDDFFARHLREVAEPIFPRSDDEVLDDAFHNDDPAVRENAIFEYIYRHEGAAFPVVLDMFEQDRDPAVKQSLFEELSQLDRPAFRQWVGRRGLESDLEPWGLAQFGWRTETAREVRTDDQEIFHQTLPLRISLREFVEVEPNKWLYHVFAPLQEQIVAGRLFACSHVDTRLTRIVLSKQLEGLHADGSLHLENTLFSGRTVMVEPRVGVFSYQTVMPVPFYPSGRIGDQSEGIIENNQVFVARVGQWELDENITVEDRPVINNVTGIIRAWGYTRPDKATFDPSGRMDQVAGLFHLGSLIDARTRDYVNTYTIGTYRGVLADTDGDGVLDLNTNPSYATVDGEIDRNRDGVADDPGVHYDTCPDIFPIEHYTQGR
jgi:hypothetical protein